MEVRILQASDAASFQTLRLAALRECPTAFSSSYEEECDTPVSRVGERLTPTSDRAVFGAFDGDHLVGTVGLLRESHLKLRHKAFIWGVYVAPAYRKRGLGRALLEATLDRAAAMPGVRQVSLGVNVTNSAAIALYQAFGFQQFGVERGFLMVDGVLHDEAHMVRVLKETAEAPSRVPVEPASCCIRQARSSDAAAMHRVRMSVRENRLISVVLSERDYLAAIEQTGRGWVVEREDEIVAFAIGNAQNGSIWALFVEPGHEGKGYGRQLHDLMVTWLWQQGHDRLWLTTDPGTRAERFYREAGWQHVGVAPSGEACFELPRP